MIKYRKNERWDTISFSCRYESDIDREIKERLNMIDYNADRVYVDVVDISIRSVVSNKSSSNDFYHYITIFYALVSINEIKVQI